MAFVKKLTPEVTRLFAHENMVANRCVAFASDSVYVYNLWTDGHVDRQYRSTMDEHGYINNHKSMSERIPRPTGLEWLIQENAPLPRAYVYVLLFGEKIRQPKG